MDADCQAVDPATVCEVDPCCGLLLCRAACSVDNPCAEGEVCADGHCVAQPCAGAPPECPVNFVCGAGADPSCERKACGSDTDCEGTCVLGTCHASPGMCDLPKP